MLGFKTQMTAIVDAYMVWDENLKGSWLDAAVLSSEYLSAEGFLNVSVIDMFRELSTLRVPLESFLMTSHPGCYPFQAGLLPDDKEVATALIHQGLVPSAPFTPHVAVTTCVLELF